MASLPVDCVASQHLQIEAMKLAFADVYRYVSRAIVDDADPRADARRRLPGLARQAHRREQGAGLRAGNPVKGGTIYLTAADESGMMVSFIQSNYMGFGSGCVEPGFGISLQNRGHGFSLKADSPNVVAPGKRPFHTIIPAFLTQGRPAGHELRRDGRQHAAAGPHADPGAHARLRPEPAGGLRRAALALQRRPEHQRRGGHESGRRCRAWRRWATRWTSSTTRYQDFGAGQFIWRVGDPAVEGYVAASDPRRDGVAAGF